MTAHQVAEDQHKYFEHRGVLYCIIVHEHPEGVFVPQIRKYIPDPAGDWPLGGSRADKANSKVFATPLAAIRETIRAITGAD